MPSTPPQPDPTAPSPRTSSPSSSATPPPPAPSSRLPDGPPPADPAKSSGAPLPPAKSSGAPLPPARSSGAPLPPAKGSGAPLPPARVPGPPPAPAAPPGTPPPPTAAPGAPGAPGAPKETPVESTTRLRPVPPAPVASPGTPGRPPVTPGPPPIPPAPPQPPRRPVGAVDLTPRPDTVGRPFVRLARPDHYDDSTTLLRPVGRRLKPRTAAIAACLVLGLGLIGGATTGSLLTGDDSGPPSVQTAYREAGQLWHGVPVDQLFPRTLKGEGAGPGRADRTWTRIAVAPDATCANAFDPLLHKALRPAGCLRLLRATYTDATQSSVTTVGLMFTKADAEATQALRSRFMEQGLDRRDDLMPRPYAAKGTLAAGFGDRQRATWAINVLTDAPVVVYAVSGFADGRTVSEPQPAADAMKSGATSAPAQAGLGHDAQGVADRIERDLRKTVKKAADRDTEQ
ncbi:MULTISPECIES: hypothetical protein [unclassified Streptomyces]|uniref:hypothetical protein n=1 Tax=unclassified Streptomyces TaxID=2593676 RepID=UPI002E188828